MSPLERLLLEAIPTGRSGRGEPPPRFRRAEHTPVTPDPDAERHRADLKAALAEHDRAAKVTDLAAYRNGAA